MKRQLTVADNIRHSRYRNRQDAVLTAHSSRAFVQLGRTTSVIPRLSQHTAKATISTIESTAPTSWKCNLIRRYAVSLCFGLADDLKDFNGQSLCRHLSFPPDG